MFEKASREKVRFNTTKGICTVEDLWDLPLKSLDEMYKGLVKMRKESKEESLLSEKKPTKEDNLLELKIDLLKHVVEVRLAEKKVRELAAEKAEKKKKIMAIIAEKQDKELYNKDVTDLEKMLAEM